MRHILITSMQITEMISFHVALLYLLLITLSWDFNKKKIFEISKIRIYHFFFLDISSLFFLSCKCQNTIVLFSYVCSRRNSLSTSGSLVLWPITYIDFATFFFHHLALKDSLLSLNSSFPYHVRTTELAHYIWRKCF